MSDSRKYYYLKLKENFFESDAMIYLESMPDGYVYANILLKLYLRSLKNEGKLMFNERIPYSSGMLAQVTRHSVGDIEKAVKVFADLGLIEIMSNGAMFITDIQHFIGTSSTEADRKRAYRKRIEDEKKGRKNIDSTQKGQMSGQMSGQTSDISPPELELELEIELEKESTLSGKPDGGGSSDLKSPDKQTKKSKTTNDDPIPYQAIIDYLNEKTGKQFGNTKTNKEKIKARWHEGYRLDDFKTVIDNKTAEWSTGMINGKPARNYLRPSTLFSGKFDAYLNDTPQESDGYLDYGRSTGNHLH